MLDKHIIYTFDKDTYDRDTYDKEPVSDNYKYFEYCSTTH